MNGPRAQLALPLGEQALFAERPLRIGSLCSGVGMIDLAVESVFPGAELAWYAQYEPPDKDGKPDRHQHAARIMAHHWPGVPNLGDITAVDYADVEPVDLLTGGWPCQDMSLAGKRASLREGTRSGLWSHVARAIGALRPSLVLLENVRSLTSAPADCDLEFCPRCMGDPGDGDPPVPDMRALARVLGDLADLGFDAEWIVVAAGSVGAPHRRQRCFILAWPAADPAHLGHERGRAARRRRSGPAHRGLTAADPQGHGRDQGRTEPARPVGRLDAAERGRASAADPDGGRRGPHQPDDVQGQPDPARGCFPWESTEYGPAIARWEAVLGRRAPWPVDDSGRLAPAFVEWMMGLPEGWVTAVPGIPRSAQLKALGNGVVPQQAVRALEMLLPAYRAALQQADGFGLIRNGPRQWATTGVACGDTAGAA